MSDSRALVEHIEALNAKTEAWVAEDPENRFAGMFVTVPDHWADYDVYTPEEFDRYLLETDYIEGHKDAYGFKYRGDLSKYSDDELREMTDSMYDQAEAELEDVRWLEEMEADYRLEQIDMEDEEADILADAYGTEWDDIQEDFDAEITVKDIIH